MGGGDSIDSRELDQTPTWAVASVCTVIILISIALEKLLHNIGRWFTERRKKSLFEALEKVKSELMILGFISLLLTFGQSYIAKICIPEMVADTMLPCRHKDAEETKKSREHRRALLDIVESSRRILAEHSSGSSCAKGKVSLISVHGIHQLHIFVFFLALYHVIFSAMIMTLGRAKIRGWKEWEREASSIEHEFSNDPTRFRFVHQTSFVRQYLSGWNRIPFWLYIVSFFRQFFRSVRKADYLAMRHGFISTHLTPSSKFDFQKYIRRSLDDDFTVVVGISPILWASAVVFLLLNVNGWQTLFWVSIAPLILTLAVGTKLQAIITQMALEIQERHLVVQGIPLVQLTDHHFWFGRPDLVLTFIHFTLFQNAFQITYFVWIWYEFGLTSCFNDNLKLITTRLCLGVGVQFLCSYVTLPLYALVSQMGSHMKRTIFDEHTAKALKKWQQGAKKRHTSSSLGSGTTPPPSAAASPARRLRRMKTTGHAAGGTGAASSRRQPHSGCSLSDTEADRPRPVEPGSPTEDFSFPKPSTESGPDLI